MNKKKKAVSRGLCLGLCLLLMVTLLPVSAAAAEKEQESVRVGWFEDSYNITGTNGERSGYRL